MFESYWMTLSSRYGHVCGELAGELENPMPLSLPTKKKAGYISYSKNVVDSLILPWRLYLHVPKIFW